MKNRLRNFIFVVIMASVALIEIEANRRQTRDQAKELKVGMIGLDTSHVTAFTKLLNDKSDPHHVPGARVVAAFKGGSPDVESSRTRIDRFTAELKDKWGVEIVGSIEELCEKVDAVLLESVDGRPHLNQVRPVFAAKKRVFIDKPFTAGYADAREIVRLSRESGTPFFSSSSLRFADDLQALKRDEKLGALLGAFTYGPAPTEPHHPDLFWYGIHAVEMLYALMGPGCESVTRVHTDGADVVVGKWKDGRVGTMRGIRDGKRDYGAVAFGAKANLATPTPMKSDYRNLLIEVVKFFQTGAPPVPPEETLEMMAFMEAADLSKARGGARAMLKDVTERKYASAQQKPKGKVMSDIRLMTLDPGHFHAALVQKDALPGVSSQVHVYAPLGFDLLEHLKRIAGYNTRKQNPTRWELEVHTGDDFLARMLRERPGNVVVIAGRNQGKIDRIKTCVENGLNALVDKPWIIDAGDFPKLEATLNTADAKRLIAYDIMTERSEITTILQRELINDADVFGTIQKGSENDPAVYMESIHHLFKLVSGAPNIRPAWFFDVKQQGEGVADVGTHLVDLAQWMLFPEQAIDYRKDVNVLSGKRWPTKMTKDEFKRVTNEPNFPDYLAGNVKDDKLEYFCNGSMTYALRGVHVKLDVIWNYEAPAGAGDTHVAWFKGSKSRIEVRQAQAHTIYVILNEPLLKAEVAAALQKKVAALQTRYPGVAVVEEGEKLRVTFPDKYRDGHEAHFGQVATRFFEYLRDPKRLPAWEKPNMLAKYYTTTKGLEMGHRSMTASR